MKLLFFKYVYVFNLNDLFFKSIMIIFFMENNDFPCQLKSIGLSCFGCCGDDWTCEKDVLNDVWLNSRDFCEIYTENEKSISDLEFFRDRFEKDEVSKSGVCMNLVDFGNGCFACPLHPLVNLVVSKDKVVAPKSDLRCGHCDVDFECESVRYWKLMSDEQKNEFVEFVAGLKLSNYAFSMRNVSGELIRDFFDLKKVE